MWVKAYVRHHDLRHPEQLGAGDLDEFLEHLAVERGLSPSSQGQARAAVLFLYKEVLRRPLEDADRSVLAGKNPKKLPTVLTRDEVGAVLRSIPGTKGLVAGLLYGSGLRLSEALQIRVKDVDPDAREIVVRSGKGGRQRIAMIPARLVPKVRDQLRRRRALHDRDLADGCADVPLPGAFARKAPAASREFGWQFLFPSPNPSRQGDGSIGRYHVHATTIQRAVKKAAKSLGITKRVTCHTFRHTFATHLLQDGYDIRTIQELLGHRSVKTTMVYTHVLNQATLDIRSPLDRLPPL